MNSQNFTVKSISVTNERIQDILPKCHIYKSLKPVRDSYFELLITNIKVNNAAKNGTLLTNFEAKQIANNLLEEYESKQIKKLA